MPDLFLEVASRDFFAFKLVFAPKSEETEPALVEMSLTTLGEVLRPVSRFSRVAVTIILVFSEGVPIPRWPFLR